MIAALGHLNQMLLLKKTKQPSGHRLLRAEVTGITTKPKYKDRFQDQRQMRYQMTCFIPFQTKEIGKERMILWLLKSLNLMPTRDLLSRSLDSLETLGEWITLIWLSITFWGGRDRLARPNNLLKKLRMSSFYLLNHKRDWKGLNHQQRD